MKNQKVKYIHKLLPVILGVGGGIFSILTALLIARPLGSELYGKIQYYISVITVLSVFLSFGLPTLLIRNTHFEEDKKSELGKSIAFFNLLSAFIFPLYFLCAYFCLSSLEKNIILILFIFLSAFFLSLSSIISSFFLGEKKLALFQLVSSFLPKCLIFLFSIILVYKIDHNSFVTYYVPLFCASYLLCSLPFLHKQYKICKPFLRKDELRLSIVFCLISLTSTVSSYLSKIIQGDYYSNLELLGAFSLSMQLLTGGVLICSIITRLSQPYFASIDKKDKIQTINYFRHIVRLNSNFAIPFCIALIVEAKQVLAFFGGETYSPYWLALVFSSAATLVQALAGPINVLFSMTNHQKALLIDGIIGVASLIVFSWSFSFITEYGAVIAYFSSCLIVSLIGFFQVFFFYKIAPFDLKTFFSILLKCIISLGIFAIPTIIKSTLHWLLINIFLGAGIIIIFFSITPFLEDRLPFINTFLNKIRTKLSVKKSQLKVEKTKFKKIFNLVYKFTFVFFILNVILMGTDKYVLSFSILNFQISFRMVLAILLIAEFIISLFVNGGYNTFYNKYVLMFVSIGLLCIFSFFIGIFINGFSNALSDIKPVSFLILVFPFYDLFSLHIINKKEVFLIFSISSILVSLGIFSFSLYLRFNDISRTTISNYFNSNYPTSGFGFRENYGVYYDGLFFPCILSTCFLYLFLFSKTKLGKKIIYFLSFILLLLGPIESQTRSFIIYIVLSIFLLFFYKIAECYKEAKSNNKSLFSWPFFFSSTAFLLLFLSAVVFLISKGYFSRLFSGFSNGDAIRINYILEVIPQLVKSPILFGKFYGYVINSASHWHIETSLLEVFLKQGLVGFVLWVSPLIVCFCFRTMHISLDTFYVSLFALLGTYFLSIFNPYLCNVSGIIVLLCSILILPVSSCNGKIGFKKIEI